MSSKKGWDEHEIEQRRRWRELTPRGRLVWLWRAKLFALRVQKANEKRERS